MTESPDIPVVLFPEKIVISCVTKSKGPLTKIIRIDPETKDLVKDGSECSMSYGSIKKIPISSPVGFANMLRSRATNQAIVHGICRHDTAKVITKPQFEKNPGTDENPIIARTKDCLKYSDGPGVILFDHDKSRAMSAGSDQALAGYSPGELISVLAGVHEIIKDASFVSTPSTSSCIYSATGDLLRGEGTGSHIYFFVKKASDIPRYLETLGKRLFLAGFGRIEISVSGSLLTRTLIDLLVGSPERLDFVAGAVCEDGLRQELPFPVVQNGELLDTETLKSLTAGEEKEYLEIVAGLSNQAKPNQEKVVSEYVNRESKKLVDEKNISIEDAIRIVKSRQDHILDDEDLLYFSRHDGGITVAEALLVGASFNKKSLADPLEPEYDGWSKSKAIFYWNDGATPNIRSFAHGEIKYRFRQFVKEGEEKEKKDGEYYPEQTIKALLDMNSKYAAVLLGGDFRIAKEGFDKALKKHTLAFLKITSLYSYYANSRVMVPVGDKGDKESRELAKTWMGWDGRRTYEDVVFDPSGREQPGVYNLFRGFPLTPKKGNWSLMRGHILNVICDGVAEHFEYVMAWMARAVQDPGGDKPGVALVLKGGKGIGKGVYANYFGSIFGEAFLPIADSESFTGKFNMHLSKSLLVFLDEAVWGGDKKAEGKLKQLITEPTVMFEPKGIDSMALSNHINIIIAGNEEWLVPATGDERRFCVLEPSDEFRQNTEYFGNIAEEKKNGGAEAMMFDLLHHDFSGVDLRKAPITNGLCEQVEQSLSSAHEFWFSVLDRGHILTARETGRPRKTEVAGTMVIDDLWPPEVYKHEIYAEYCQWCNIQKERYVLNERRFWKSTWKIWFDGFPGRNRRRSKTSESGFFEVVFLPSIKDARIAFTKATKIVFDDEASSGPREVVLPFDDQF